MAQVPRGILSVVEPSPGARKSRTSRDQTSVDGPLTLLELNDEHHKEWFLCIREPRLLTEAMAMVDGVVQGCCRVKEKEGGRRRGGRRG